MTCVTEQDPVASPEAYALATIEMALDSLDAAAARRVVHWAIDKYGAADTADVSDRS